MPGVWLWRADRQERLNRQLIEAILRDDTLAALVALKCGAYANARDEPVVPGWRREEAHRFGCSLNKVRMLPIYRTAIRCLVWKSWAVETLPLQS